MRGCVHRMLQQGSGAVLAAVLLLVLLLPVTIVATCVAAEFGLTQIRLLQLHMLNDPLQQLATATACTQLPSPVLHTMPAPPAYHPPHHLHVFF